MSDINRQDYSSYDFSLGFDENLPQRKQVSAGFWIGIGVVILLVINMFLPFVSMFNTAERAENYRYFQDRFDELYHEDSVQKLFRMIKADPHLNWELEPLVDQGGWRELRLALEDEARINGFWLLRSGFGSDLVSISLYLQVAAIFFVFVFLVSQVTRITLAVTNFLGWCAAILSLVSAAASIVVLPVLDTLGYSESFGIYLLSAISGMRPGVAVYISIFGFLVLVGVCIEGLINYTGNGEVSKYY